VRFPSVSAVVPLPRSALPPGAIHASGRLDRDSQLQLLAEIATLVAQAPFYRPHMPRSGAPFSILMTNCGALGWVADKTGYRYQARHPVTGEPWPPIPASLLALWREFADGAPEPEACLINLYGPGTKLGSHVDADEANRTAPVVSVSLGAPAVFHVGGPARRDPKVRLTLRSGDVFVLGGEARHVHHGIDRLLPDDHDLQSSVLPPGQRINLTLRRVTLAPAR
jgi:DNA oxidative demethylase